MKRFIVAIVVAMLSGVLALPAQSAPKPFTGSYDLVLLPDPSPNAFIQVDMDKCFNVVPAAKDTRTISVPRAGKFTVDLDAGDPLHTGANDWDLFLTDKTGKVLSSSTSGGGKESGTVKLKKKSDVNIIVCNLNGTPEATVKYVLK